MENQSSKLITLTLHEPRPELEEQLWEFLCSWDCCGVESSADAMQLRIYMPHNTSVKSFLESLGNWLKMQSPQLDTEIEVTEIEPRNWNEEWRNYFHATPVGDRFVVLPPWESVPAEYHDRIPVIIEPGMAFGTGTHATTQLCLRLFDRIPLGNTCVLDVGTGSAILSIAASLLGARWCLGFDIDPDILENAATNLRLNNISPEKVSICVGSLDMLRESLVFDVVLCNMLFNHAAPLLPRLARFLKDGGHLLLSGFLLEETPLVCEAVKSAGFEISDLLEQDEWGALVGVKA